MLITYRVHQAGEDGGLSNSRFFSFPVLLLAVILISVTPDQAQAYIGPGAGFAVMGSFLVMFTALLSGILVFLTWPIRYIIRAIRGRNAYAKSRVKRFVVLGLDGMDPVLTEKFLADGKLPNFARLRNQGCFKQLATTIPPISPVAWSSFQTGSNPGKHNIFDFLTINRQTYQPRLSSVDIKGPGRKINLGKYQFPLGKTNIRLLRKGQPFWKVLGEHGIFSNIIRVPITFPPEKFNGIMLSAMCVPDLRGSQGTFSFYTTITSGNGEHTGGERYHVSREGNRIKSYLVGPENPFRKDSSILKCPFVITINDETSEADITVNGQRYKLKQNIYSDWVRIDFKAAPGVKVTGICKFLLLRTTPEFALYVTPINISPEKPVMPIAHPAVYSTYLAKRQGPFATLGLAEDTWALNEEILNDNEFMEQSIQIDTEREKMFFDALDKLKRGLCICVFDGTDRIQHTFWRDIDEEHPARQKQGQSQSSTQRLSKGRNAVEQVYQRMDVLVGKMLGRCKDKNTVIMIISDHGFNTFRYGVDLNRWLEQNDYLTRKAGYEDKKHLVAVDWSQTRAFGIGLAGIFLNLKGREKQGIVEPGKEAAQLRKEIAEKLTGLKDTTRGQVAIRQVYIAPELYQGPYKGQSPDLIVGYNKGYRASWQMAIGQITDEIFHPNTKAWSGDHCIDHTVVPGVLFCNRKVKTENPRLIDIGPTVLDMFGIKTPGHMDGHPLAVADAAASATHPTENNPANKKR
jgi:predicted AlkP superfamily phosphohydrolase/phosphomutase